MKLKSDFVISTMIKYDIINYIVVVSLVEIKLAHVIRAEKYCECVRAHLNKCMR